MKIIYILVFLCALSLQAQYLLTGPMLGHTDANSAKIWCSLDQVGRVQIHISEGSKLGSRSLEMVINVIVICRVSIVYIP